jgi:hypothetical protein
MVDRAQSTRPHTMVDRATADAHVSELPARDDSVLALCNGRNPPIDSSSP